jgi:hypothetical protein
LTINQKKKKGPFLNLEKNLLVELYKDKQLVNQFWNDPKQSSLIDEEVDYDSVKVRFPSYGTCELPKPSSNKLDMRDCFTSFEVESTQAYFTLTISYKNEGRWVGYSDIEVKNNTASISIPKIKEAEWQVEGYQVAKSDIRRLRFLNIPKNYFIIQIFKVL